ncbi:M23 family metallopeptidase [Cryobacterium sp. TMT2-15-1]|uniref:M23 family metallopeptidase n=1 Tax=Cryobacterium sp. TMT2-15-1 TaxID=1259246 RepID=UPI00106B7CAA|nr:M23 family metallopeptidase [Cryobacterium sp. TMT2-15-1]TFC60173.1 M23 family metallopeptidase [Cryobacterium sp. TMT2-15-1]
MNAFRLLLAAALLPLSCLSIVRSDAAGVTPSGAASVTETAPETAAESAAETATSGTWHWPLAPPHPVLRGFQAPATLYAPGHRGLDLSAKVGRQVVAPADGIVSFAGVVVDRPVLSIEHADGLVSSIEPVSASVAVGDRVAAGQPVGQVADGGHCAGQCLHLGARLNGGYVSPLLYLVGVPRAVLLPALLL